MANIAITSDAWTEISITSGTIQNISATADIELSAEQTDNSGVVLKPSEIYQWDNETIYARAVTEDKGALRVVNFKKAAGGGGYVLPVASASTLGGVKVGNNLSIDASGVLSANAGGYTLPPATASTLGGVIIGDNITVDANGEISVAAPYSLPKAAANTLGGVKVGTNLSIDGDGVLSAVGNVSYSTTEQVIGTWIDGKPLYQITISETMPTVATDGTRVTKTIDINSLNIKFVHNLDGIVNAENTDFNVYNSVNINAFINFTNDIHYFTEAQVIKSSSVNPNYDVLHIGSSIKWTSGQPCYITLQYTKTTD